MSYINCKEELKLKWTKYCVLGAAGDDNTTDNTNKIIFTIIFFDWDSLHARLNSHYKAWSYKKKKHRKIKAYRNSL